jgi:prepilin-type N-terminal cleavage/methylation domain-containing protein
MWDARRPLTSRCAELKSAGPGEMVCSLSLRERTGVRGSHCGGYTLLELVVVMTILALMAAAVVPLYQGSVTRLRSDEAGRRLLATMKFAHERAIAEGAEYRLYLDHRNNTYWVMRLDAVEDGEKQFRNLARPYGGKRMLPEGMRMEIPTARRDSQRDAHYIAFFPSGACDYATVKLRKSGRSMIAISTRGRLGRFDYEAS